MKWCIPAKTFLVGEYAAVEHASALLITTKPYFELSLNTQTGLGTIHPDSPAGRYWQSKQGLNWVDPYNGRGGFGASSAQFIACYLALCHLEQQHPHLEELLDSYYQYAWDGTGLQPSGYDVIAQVQAGCVFINRKRQELHSFPWVFADLSFLLIHTGQKLATHEHLKQATLPADLTAFSQLADIAKQAFDTANSSLLVETVNAYHQLLSTSERVAAHSLQLIETLRTYPEIVAVKGCGAMGADVLLVLCARSNVLALKSKLQQQHLTIVADESALNPLGMENIPQKT